MSADYTPTTTEIREEVAWRFDGDAEARAKAAFDRWLDEHDAQVKAEERERVVELAARRADEGYRLGEYCDDIARDIRALAVPPEPDEREEDR